MSYRYIIIDGQFLCRRAWEASDHKPDAVFGAALGKVAQLRQQHHGAAIVIAWDGDGGLRKSMDDGYKAGRKSPAKEYTETVHSLCALLPLVGVTQVRGLLDGHDAEADDVAWTISRLWLGPHALWSADKDWLQCVTISCHLLKPDTRRRPDGIPPDMPWRDPDKVITAVNIVKETGRTALGWHAYLALAGDSVDGIKGLPRVGAKRAADMLAAVPNLVELLLDGARCQTCEGTGQDVERCDREMVFEGHPCSACVGTGYVPGDDVARHQARKDATMTRWVEHAITHRDALQHSSDLVRLRFVDLATTHPVDWSPETERAVLDVLVPMGMRDLAERLLDQVTPPPAPEDMPF